MPRVNGMETIPLIRRAVPETKIIILSTYGEPQFINKAKALGAHGYLLKNCSKPVLLTTIHTVFKGDIVFETALCQVNTEANQYDHFLKAFSLTKCELEIIRLIKQHKTNQEIAQDLFSSVYTVETHRKNIMHKLDFKHPTQLISFAIEQGL